MSTIVNKWWFSTADELVGIIKCHDDITGEDKFYIGGADGIDENIDAENIKSFGAKFIPDLIK